MKILAVIPARNGSVRIKNKNIRDFHGKPLVAWAIEAARDSSLITRTIVSTNDKEIADIAASYGADVPFIRPDELANHTVGIEPVLVHALEELKKNGEEFDAVILLMPTNPLRTSEHVDKGIQMYIEDEISTSVVAVHQAAGNHNPHWILREDSDGVKFFNGTSLKEIITRSQDLPPSYSRNDVLYVINPANLYETPSNLYGDQVRLYVMDDFYNADINTEEDWWIAHDKFRRKYLS